MALVSDTGPLYAAMDEADMDHRSCAALFLGTVERVVVPSPVLVELEWLATKRLGGKPFEHFLNDVDAGAITIVDLTGDDYRRCRDLMRQYADFPLGFVDAAVVAVVERLSEPKLATLDHRHFLAVRPAHVPSLTLLPEYPPAS